MAENLDLKKGLDLPVRGVAEPNLIKTVIPTSVAVKPCDFAGWIPRLLVKEGDTVLVGTPVLADKLHPEIKVVSPASGTVQSIVRGDKRKLLAVVIRTDGKQECVNYGQAKAEDAAQVKTLLLETGLWPAIIRRPYGTIARLEDTPKAIFLSAFSTAPLAPDLDFTLKDDMRDIQTGIDALAKIAPVHLSLRKSTASATPFHKMEHVVLHAVGGPHPAGNVGVQISHIAPIRKGEVVWTMAMEHVAALGHAIRFMTPVTQCKVAITGPAAPQTGYVATVGGAAVSELTETPDGVRVVGGNLLTGETLGADGYLGFFHNQVTLLAEGNHRELLGWANPIRHHVHSASRCYFSWFMPWKRYKMDTNLHGGVRAFVQTKCFADVTPMNLFPIYLLKACLAGDIEKMEKYGIYEVLPEDFALCDYVDPSKNEAQAIIQDGINLMMKEME